VALTGGQQIHVLSFSYSMSAGTINLNLQSHTTTANAGQTWYGATTPAGVQGQNDYGWFATTSGEALDLNLSAGSVNVSWTVVYAKW
jgi:hypothetical protein